MKEMIPKRELNQTLKSINLQFMYPHTYTMMHTSYIIFTSGFPVPVHLQTVFGPFHHQSCDFVFLVNQ